MHFILIKSSPETLIEVYSLTYNGGEGPLYVCVYKEEIGLFCSLKATIV